MEERGGHLPARRVPVRLMRIDVNVFLGAYPYRRVPGTSPESVLRAMERVGIDEARQRHPNDRAPEVPAAAVRALVRCDADVRLVVTHADRAFVEEVHFGSAPEEAARIWWDICWIWGPPEDHLATLLQTVGVERFVFGTGQPLRIPENSVAKLDLLELAPQHRAAIESENARRGLGL